MKLSLVSTTFIIYISLFSTSIFAAENTATTIPEIIPEVTKKEDKHSRYPVIFFAQYTPQNAMDMINRVPGFTFNRGSNARGFGGNAGNVLIDGSRPTSKSSSLRDALQRIPASQVSYIEIFRGGVSAGEAAGQSIVANVVKKDTQTSGTWEVKTTRAPNGVVKPRAEGSIATKLGEWDTSFDAKIGEEPDTRDALIEDFDKNDVLTSSTDETRDTVYNNFTINGEGARHFADGKLTINASLDSNKWRKVTKRDTFNVSSINSNITNETTPDETFLLNERKDYLSTELGIDWVTTINDWKIRAIALTSSADNKYEYIELIESDIVENNEINDYLKETVDTEHIIRMTYGQVGSSSFKPEFGFEIANNRLDSDITLIENGIEEILEGADVVEELRVELFANFVYNYNPTLTFEGSFTYEKSNIEVTSDLVTNQKFNFFKPRLSANYTINESSTISLIAEYAVEQLDFSDFAASASSTDDRTTSGNNNLAPEKVTSITAFYDLRFSERGSLNMEFYFEEREDIHEEIFLPSGNSGLGNAGDAKFWGIKTNIKLPLDAVLDNASLRIEHSYKDTEFFDPIINDYRTIYNYIPNYLEVEFRHDVTQYDFTWGMEYKDDYIKTRYYVDEIETTESNNRLVKFFIETTRFFNMKTRLKIQNVNTTNFDRTRYFYNNDRSGEFEGSEVSHRIEKPVVELSFSGSF